MLRPLARTFTVSVHASGAQRKQQISTRKQGIAASSSSSSSQRPSSNSSSSTSKQSSSPVPQTLLFGAELSRPGMKFEFSSLSMQREFYFLLEKRQNKEAFCFAPLEKKGDNAIFFSSRSMLPFDSFFPPHFLSFLFLFF